MGVFKSILRELENIKKLLGYINDNLEAIRKGQRKAEAKEAGKSEADKIAEGINNILTYASTKRKEDD